MGSCFLKLVKLLHLELPLIDPSLFIHRFCARLEFNEKTHEVSITSLRLDIINNIKITTTYEIRLVMLWKKTCKFMWSRYFNSCKVSVHAQKNNMPIYFLNLFTKN